MNTKFNYPYESENIVQYEFRNQLDFFKWFLINKKNTQTIGIVMHENWKYLLSIMLTKICLYKSYDIQYKLPFSTPIKNIGLRKKIKKYLSLTKLINKLMIKIVKNFKHKTFSNSKDSPKNFRLNFFDIENLLQEKTINKVKKSNYILFLDSHIHEGTDSDFNGYKTVDKTEHYRKLNIFFENLEKIMGFDIIISGHPKYKKNYENLFCGREIHFNRNKILIENANYVIGYDSTSIYYAIYMKKKIALINSNEIKALISENNNKYYYIENLKNLLNVPCYNISCSNDDIKDIENYVYDFSYYTKFINNYLYNKDIDSFKNLINNL